MPPIFGLWMNCLVVVPPAPHTVRDGFVHLLGLLLPPHALLQKCLLFWGKSPVTISRKGIQYSLVFKYIIQQILTEHLL